MPRKKIEANPDVVFLVAQLFFEGLSMREIARKVNSQMKLAKPLNRESVYPLLAEARRLNLVRLLAPIEQKLATEIAGRFGFDERQITVVRTQGRHFNEFVAAEAAEVALRLLREVASSSPKGWVGLGLGPGRATLDFSRYLGPLLQSAINVPPLKLFAICAGSPARSPEYSSTSFFNLFPAQLVKERIGLFAETVVPCSDFEKIKKRPGVAEAFAARDGIDIVVTSMGDFYDEDDLLSTFLKQAGTDLEDRRRKGWIGSVQYRPFSASGPIEERSEDMRAVTLFELDDFARLAQTKHRHVLLIARQCGHCGKTRAAALRPVLEAPRLRLWSELVMDEATARELLQAPGSRHAR